MFIIADSGSTKTEWVILNKHCEIEARFFTKGLNPNFTPITSIMAEIKSGFHFFENCHTIQHVFFYGSGCSSLAANAIMHDALIQFFPIAEITIKNDLYAAVYATAGHNPAIVCILGTGSNACFFDGKIISYDDFSLGYLLGDEGSGAYLGKQLLHHFFYDQLPLEIHHQFKSTYQLTRNEVIEQIYRKQQPNYYLASFAPFIKQFEQHPYFKNLLHQSFTAFFVAYVTRIPMYQNFPLHFIGSIATHFKESLQLAANAMQLNVGEIMQSPMPQLIKYHLNK